VTDGPTGSTVPLERESRAGEDFDCSKLTDGEAFDGAEDTIVLTTTSCTYWYLGFGLNRLRATAATRMADSDTTAAEL
jgi:hypothetical protein